MKKLTKLVSCVVAVLLIASAIAACSGKEPGSKEKAEVKIAALKGPTGIGMASLMEDSKAGKTENNYIFELSGAPDEIVGKLTSGSIDIAAVPTNLASVLYNKTSGNIRIAAVNTLGVLYILEQGDSIKSISDLKGKSITATGQGSTPEFALNYILEQNGLTPGKDVTINYLSEHSELAALAVSGKETLVLLPEPFVTTVSSKNGKIRKALDITEEWRSANKKSGSEGAELAMGCIVVRKDFAENNKAALDTFLKEYKASTEFVNKNIEEASRMAVNQGIMPDAEIVEKAIPNCNIVYIDGSDMKNSVQSYLRILHEADPKSIGGKMPNEDFFYEK